MDSLPRELCEYVAEFVGWPSSVVLLGICVVWRKIFQQFVRVPIRINVSEALRFPDHDPCTNFDVIFRMRPMDRSSIPLVFLHKVSTLEVTSHATRVFNDNRFTSGESEWYKIAAAYNVDKIRFNTNLLVPCPPKGCEIPSVKSLDWIMCSPWMNTMYVNETFPNLQTLTLVLPLSVAISQDRFESLKTLHLDCVTFDVWAKCIFPNVAELSLRNMLDMSETINISHQFPAVENMLLGHQDSLPKYIKAGKCVKIHRYYSDKAILLQQDLEVPVLTISECGDFSLVMLQGMKHLVYLKVVYVDRFQMGSCIFWKLTTLELSDVQTFDHAFVGSEYFPNLVTIVARNACIHSIIDMPKLRRVEISSNIYTSYIAAPRIIRGNLNLEKLQLYNVRITPHIQISDVHELHLHTFQSVHMKCINKCKNVFIDTPTSVIFEAGLYEYERFCVLSECHIIKSPEAVVLCAAGF